MWWCQSGGLSSGPRKLLAELHESLVGVEEVLATLEELLDEEGLKRIRRAEAEYQTGEYSLLGRSCEVETLLE